MYYTVTIFFSLCRFLCHNVLVKSLCSLCDRRTKGEDALRTSRSNVTSTFPPLCTPATQAKTLCCICVSFVVFWSVCKTDIYTNLKINYSRNYSPFQKISHHHVKKWNGFKWFGLRLFYLEWSVCKRPGNAIPSTSSQNFFSGKISWIYAPRFPK